MLDVYDKWVHEFLESWKKLDYKRTLKTLDEKVEYYENPIDEPCKDFNEIIGLWEVVEQNQKEIEYQYEIISYNEKYCVVNWQMTRTMIETNKKQKIDGIFQISLNKEGKCSFFKQWRYTKNL